MWLERERPLARRWKQTPRPGFVSGKAAANRFCRLIEVDTTFRNLVGSGPTPVEVFQSKLCRICGSFDLESSRARLNYVGGDLSVAQLGGLDIAQVALDAHRVTRSASNIRRDPGNHYFLILQHRGTAKLLQNSVATLAQPGDMFVVDSTLESQFVYDGAPSQQISVHLPREEMTQRFGSRIHGGLAIEGRDPLAIAMKALLAKLMSATETAVQTRTVEAFYSVFGTLLIERSLGNRGSLDPDRQIVQSAQLLIAERYTANEFNSQALADLLGVSLRRLQRAFQITDETPHHRLQRFRVEAAHQALQANRTRKLGASVSSIAFSVGFAELSTFYRLYRKRFGYAPGESHNTERSDACCKDI